MNHVHRFKFLAIAICSALLIVFAIVSYSAVLSKNATFDEPLHALAGFTHRFKGDFRLDPEDPALFGYWAALPHRSDELKIDYNSDSWTQMPKGASWDSWRFCRDTLFWTPGNDVDGFINRSRLMFVIVGVALGAMIAIWSWQLAGVATAIIATALFAFDPNFMGHAPLVKNDVLTTFCMLLMAYSLWRFGRRGTWLWMAMIALSCAIAVNVKFSGVLCGPIIFISLLLRALLPQPWLVLGINLMKRWQRLLAAPAVCIFVAIVSFVVIWACYGFRFVPTSDSDALLNTNMAVTRAKAGTLRARMNVQDETQEIPEDLLNNEPLHWLERATVWGMSSHVLPQAWLYGLLYTRATTYTRSCYLLGVIGRTGWWYYFPCAMLFKTPTATLLAIVAAIASVFLFTSENENPAKDTSQPSDDKWWTLACLALTPIIYGGTAMAGNLNLGLRHVLPVYPFIFIAIALGLSRLTANMPRTGTIISALLIIGVAA